jgi:very-short-patch-repair endonuclease
MRQEKLESLGIRFLRFKDEDVKKDLSEVARAITNWVELHKNDSLGIMTHPPSPSKEGEFELN